MAHRVDTNLCLKCGLCITKCPEEAIIPLEKVMQDELELQPVRIDPGRCNDCGFCETEEYWCPAQAIKRA